MLRTYIIVLSYIFFFTLSCSTTSTIKLSERDYVTIDDFKRGKNLLSQGDKQQACHTFNKIKKEKMFPIESLLTIYQLKSCHLKSSELISIFNQFDQIDTFLKEDFLKTAYQIAKSRNLNESAVLFGLQYNKYPKLKKERDEIAKELVELAQLTKLPSLINATQDNLYIISPRKLKYRQSKDFYLIAKDFAHVREFKQARKYYQKVIKHEELDLAQRLDAYYRYALTYKLQRDKITYSKQLEKMNLWLSHLNIGLSEKELNQKAWSYRLKLVRALWTVSKRSQAEQYLSVFLKNPTLPENIEGEIYLLKGLIELEKRNYPSVYKNLNLVLKLDLVSGEARERALWNLFWAYYTSGQYEEAIKTISNSIDKLQNQSYRNKLIYWRGKSLQKLSMTAKSQEDFKNLTKDHSYQYYVILAHMELGLNLPNLDFSHYTPATTKDIKLRWLIELEESDLAKSYLKINRSHNYLDYHYARYFDGGIHHFFSLDEKQRDRLYSKHLPLAFPAPEKNLISAVALKRKLPAAFIYAIARQESAFNPYARSWADAYGFLQVTPEKAKQISKSHDIPYKKPEDLYDLTTNVEIGSVLLKKIAKANQNRFIPLVATYNAGSKPVKRWIKERYRQDPIEFIEMIPYKETRNYIKLVFRNYVTYQRLLGRDISLKKDFFNKPLIN